VKIGAVKGLVYLRGSTKILPVFSAFRPTGTEDFHKNLLSDCDSRESK
jgi:hypothetical protein